MKPTDFSYYITGFLTKYLPDQIGASNNTVSSYRDTFMLFLIYIRDYHQIPVEKLNIKDISKEKVELFLSWIENERKCSVQTRNSRLAAIHSFFKYLQYENP